MAEPDDDTACVICTPIGVGMLAVPGCTIEYCDRCKAPVWVSPATREAVSTQPRVVFICMSCVTKEELQTPLQPPTPGQLEEVARYLPDPERRRKILRLLKKRKPKPE